MMCNRQVHLVIAASFLGIFSSAMGMYIYKPKKHKKMGMYYYKKNKEEKTEKEKQDNVYPLTISKDELEAALEAGNTCICTSHCKNLDPVFGILRHNGVVNVVDNTGKLSYTVNGRNTKHLEELKQKAMNVHIKGRFQEIILSRTSSPIHENDHSDKRRGTDNVW